MTPNTDRYQALRDAIAAGTDTPAMWRNELARRIRCARAVSAANDPRRVYRQHAIAAMRTGAYGGIFGMGRAPKEA